jgi:VWFA-related protein
VDGLLAPPYSGEVWVDEESGVIVKFRSKAEDIPLSFALQSAEMTIDYSNVPFADGTSFILPITSTVSTAYRGEEATRNVVQFRGCHKFRAKARMITDVSYATHDPGKAAPAAENLTADIEQNEKIYRILSWQLLRESLAAVDQEQEDAMNKLSVTTLGNLAAMQKRAQRNADLHTPPEQRPATSPRSAVPTFKVNVNLVLVSVVLRNGKGQAIGDLKKEDFRLFDNRKPHPIQTFSLNRSNPGEAAGEEESDPVSVTKAQAVSRENDVAYVFDDLHMTSEELAKATAAASSYLAQMHAEDRAAIFATSGETAVDFTADQDRLQAALRGVKAHAGSGLPGCPPVSEYEADLILNQHDADVSAIAAEDALDCMFQGHGKPDTAQLNMAARTARARASELLSNAKSQIDGTLQILNDVIAKAAAKRGQRNIVLVSPGFFMLTADARQKAASLIQQAIQLGIVVNALDLAGLQGAGTESGTDLGSEAERVRLANEESSARRGVLADLAYGTGGVFFRNNNDLQEGFRRTSEAPEFVYVLGFVPEKLDGKFHKLKVEVASRGKVTIQVRPGYYALKPASNPWNTENRADNTTR